jgi:type I restriction enzyme S subunit
MPRAGRLRQGILKRAFAGCLMPQDPSDEPAAKLMERIRTQNRVMDPAENLKKNAQLT